MARILATAFLILVALGVGKMIWDVQMFKFKKFLEHFLK
jgi:hypothetical protein